MSLWVICVLDNGYTKRKICWDSFIFFPLFPFLSHVESSVFKEAPDVVLHLSLFTISWRCCESGPSSVHLAEGCLWSCSDHYTWIDGWEFHGMRSGLISSGLIGKWDTQLSRSISNKLIWFGSTPPLFFHHVRSRTQSPITTRHTTSVEKVSRWKIWQWKFFVFDPSAACGHTKQSYFWFHSEQRKCQLSHSSLKSCWRIIMNWITARAMPFCAFS